MLRRNVLIFHQAALGDFVLTWPIALAVARILAQSRIIFVTAASKGKLAESVLRVESTDAENGWHALYQPNVALDQLPSNVQRSLQNATVAIVFRGGESDTLAHTLTRLQPEIRVIDISTEPTPAQHLIESLIEQTRSWQPLHAASEQILNGVRQRGLSIARTPSVDVLIHPGSGGEAKRWPLQQFRELARQLRASGQSIRFVIGEVEAERFPLSDLQSLRDLADVVQLPTYAALLSEIAVARSFFGNDSGPSHLAAIVGTPTVAIFGPTDPAIWSPVGPKVAVVRSTPIESVTVDQVLAARKSLM